jgi:hypothetical protein
MSFYTEREREKKIKEAEPPHCDYIVRSIKKEEDGKHIKVYIGKGRQPRRMCWST